MSRTVRALAALTLMALFVAGPVAAVTPSYGSGASLWSSAWQWLVELILPGGPNDAKEPPPPGPDDDAGGGLDPNGVKVFGVTGEPRAEAGPAVR
jgi:hypothetical protein